MGREGASSGTGGWGLVAQFPAPLKSRGCAPCSSGRKSRAQPAFSGARGTAREAPPDPHPTTHPPVRAAAASGPAPAPR
ncbi:hypothetical protein F9278_02895 [Streptomyces phaeolivaceus]|uniref:Uncharacterized protein n=1 Tax=Streptomyces phaeolivaceus TaxID=2653200 RepID=A0A5P8JXW0_9ACTN|nr:hypothetical protein F9278_02895 [Streptomyces phaeolivaceus]